MHRMLFRGGHRSIRHAPVLAATAIYAGDLIYLMDGVARPASDFAVTELEVSLVAFAKHFLGVAQANKYAGQTDAIAVDVSPWSVYEFQVGRFDYAMGDNLSPLMTLAGFDRNTLFQAAHPDWAIARAAEFRTNTNLLLVTFASRFTTGTPPIGGRHAA